MANPGDQVPYGADYLVRRIDDLERKLKELAPSVAASLVSTVAGAVLSASDSSYIADAGITTTGTIMATTTFTVPAGFTRAQVTGFAAGQAMNTRAVGDYIYCQVVFDGSSGGEMYAYAPSGISTGIVAPAFRNFSGLSDGETFDVSIKVRSNGGAWDASSPNLFTIYASVLFLR